MCFCLFFFVEFGKFCFERGINARQNSTGDMIKFLKVWLRFSSKMGFTHSKCKYFYTLNLFNESDKSTHESFTVFVYFFV